MVFSQPDSRRWSNPFNKLTGFRRPHQTIPQSQQTHGVPEMLSSAPSETLAHPHHYHSHRPQEQQQYLAPPPRAYAPDAPPNFSHPRTTKVRFAGSPPQQLPTQAQPTQRNRTNSTSSSSTHSSTCNPRTHTYANSNSTHSNPVSIASSRSSFELEPSGPVAEWCHQMHIMQGRKYDWCVACFPRPQAMSFAGEQEGGYAVEQQGMMEHEELGGSWGKLMQQKGNRKAVRFYGEQEGNTEDGRREVLVRKVRVSREAGHAYQ